MFSAAPEVRTARATPSTIFYGAPYHRWIISFGTVEGCGGDTIADAEVTTVSGVTDLPIGTHAMRTVETTITTTPSSYLRFSASPVLSGSLTIDTATQAFVNGSFTAQLTIAGAPTEVAGMFSAPVCL